MCKYQWLFSDPITTADACARRWVLEADFHRRAKKICVMGFPGRVFFLILIGFGAPSGTRFGNISEKDEVFIRSDF